MTSHQIGRNCARVIRSCNIGVRPPYLVCVGRRPPRTLDGHFSYALFDTSLYEQRQMRTLVRLLSVGEVSALRGTCAISAAILNIAES